MALVDYSDSESSSNEDTAESKPKSQPTKGSFQKIVDRSNPGKIKVSLPSTVKDDTTNHDEPPAKRAKIGGGAFSSFNSFLPAPKKTGAAAPKSLGGGATGAGRNAGLGSWISLKTGAAPAFSRNPEPNFGNGSGYEDNEETKGEDSNMGLPPPSAQIPAEEVKLVGKPLMFKPLSVARKPQKKKITSIPKATENMSSQGSSATILESAKEPPKKVSLFSVPQDADDDTVLEPKGEYQPMLYGAKPEQEEPEHFINPYSGDQYNNGTGANRPAPPPAAQAAYEISETSNSLDNIASDLHLSASERRQLFGRQGSRNLTASKVVNFNTDEEYRSNEEFRAAGEQPVHNPVRSIAPGKHSLKQLLNAAVSQKDALEESFAKGYANRKEASGRYGW